VIGRGRGELPLSPSAALHYFSYKEMNVEMDRLMLVAHPVHKNAVLDALTRRYSSRDVAQSYGLSEAEEVRLRSLVKRVDEARNEALHLLLFAYKRKNGVFLSYEKHIVEPDEYSTQYNFTADLAYDYPGVFPAMDNHGVADLLCEAAVFLPEEGQDDPESGCYYVYFKTEEAARGFIERLNAYIVKKSKEEEHVS